MLNEMYIKFDTCLEQHNVYKVETIGDSYMVAGGLPERNNEHAVEIIDMAFDMLNSISYLKYSFAINKSKIINNYFIS
jgi:guanylate cyclase 2F